MPGLVVLHALLGGVLLHGGLSGVQGGSCGGQGACLHLLLLLVRGGVLAGFLGELGDGIAGGVGAVLMGSVEQARCPAVGHLGCRVGWGQLLQMGMIYSLDKLCHTRVVVEGKADLVQLEGAQLAQLQLGEGRGQRNS